MFASTTHLIIIAVLAVIIQISYYAKYRNINQATVVTVVFVWAAIAFSYYTKEQATKSDNPTTQTIQELAQDRLALARTEAKSLDLLLIPLYRDTAKAANNNELSHDVARKILLRDNLSKSEHVSLFEYMAECFNHYSPGGNLYPFSRLAAVEWIEAYRSSETNKYPKKCYSGYPFEV